MRPKPVNYKRKADVHLLDRTVWGIINHCVSVIEHFSLAVIDLIVFSPGTKRHIQTDSSDFLYETDVWLFTWHVLLIKNIHL